MRLQLILLLALIFTIGCSFIRDFSEFRESDLDASTVDAAITDGPVVLDGCSPAAEVCNGQDDDCNGVDDDRPTECSVENGVTACISGTCGFGGCDEGWDDCDGDGLSCEHPTTFDRLNCGECGVVCDSSQVCLGGACRTGSFEWAWFGGDSLTDGVSALARTGFDLHVASSFTGSVELPGLSSPLNSVGFNVADALFFVLSTNSGQLAGRRYFQVGGEWEAGSEGTQTSTSDWDVAVSGDEVGYVFESSTSFFGVINVARDEWSVSSSSLMSAVWVSPEAYNDASASGLFLRDARARYLAGDGEGGFYLSLQTNRSSFTHASGPDNRTTSVSSATTDSFFARFGGAGGVELNPIGTITEGLFPREFVPSDDGEHVFFGGGLSEGTITPETGEVISFDRGEEHETPVLGYWNVADRELQWALPIECPDPDEDFLRNLVADGSGGVFFSWTCNDGPTTTIGSIDDLPGEDFIGHVDSEGTVDWARAIGEGLILVGDLQYFEDTLYGVFVSDSAVTSVDLGTGPIGTNGAQDIVLAAFDPASGDTIWVSIIGSSSAEYVTALLVERVGARLVFYIGGYHFDSVTYGEFSHSSAGSTDAMVLRYELETE